MDAALRLGDGHALDAMHASLELQAGEGRVARLGDPLGLDGDRDVLVAPEVGLHHLEDLGVPAAPLRIPHVHAGKVAGEERRLLASLTCLDLDDDVLVVHRVAREEQGGEALGRRLGALLQRSHLVGERGVDLAQLTRRAQVLGRSQPLPVRGDHGPQLRVAPPELPGRGLVTVDVGVRELLLDVVVLDEQVGAGLEHQVTPLRRK